MTKKYTLAETEVADEQKTITISEEVTETRERKVTMAQLREEHANKVAAREAIGKEADAIVNMMEEISIGLGIETVDLPVRFTPKTK